MKRVLDPMVALVVGASLLIAGCTQAPAPTPTIAPPAQPKAAEPTKAPAAPTGAPAAPTKAPAAAPTAVPAPKVDFPTKGKAITIIVPFEAGGANDIAARALAPYLEKELQTTFQVVNKPGAGSQVGVTELAKSKPDGYTIAYISTQSAIYAYLDVERRAAYGRKDLQPITQHASDPGFIAVRADSSMKTLKDLLDAAKAEPGKMPVGAGAKKADNHFTLLLLEQMAGVKFSIVNFGSGAPAITALLGGHVDGLCLTGSNFTSQYKSGQVRLLGVSDRQRSPMFPDIPTLEAQGYKLYFATTRGFVAPGGTPKEIVEILNGAIKKVMDNAEMKNKMAELAVPVQYGSTAEYAAQFDEIEAKVKPLLETIKD